MNPANARNPGIDIVKGVVVTTLCVLGALLQMGIGFDHVDDLPFTVAGVAIGGAPLGVGFGAIMGHVRKDRVLFVIACVLALVSLLLMLGTLTTDSLEWHGRVFRTYPWIVIGAVVLGWWTRRPEPPTVPAMRVQVRRFLPRFRPLTAVEISTLLAVSCALVIATGADAPPRYLFDTDHEAPSTLQLMGVFATLAVPLGVGVGKVAAMITRGRWFLLPVIALVGAGYGWTMMIGMLETIEFAAWSPLAVVVTVIAIALLARPDRE